ncbi:MAG: hypothetical protein ACL7BU_05630 [Candidatus Phlomobacter fragariae]
MRYHGKVIKSSDIMFMHSNTTYISNTFLSTTATLDNVIPFLKDKLELIGNEISVFYEIQHIEALVDANISGLLNDGKDKVLFWPQTQSLSLLILNLLTTKKLLP